MPPSLSDQIRRRLLDAIERLKQDRRDHPEKWEELERRSKTPNEGPAWDEIQRILGRDIYPRPEDRDWIRDTLALHHQTEQRLAGRLSRTERAAERKILQGCQQSLEETIVQKARLRIPSMTDRGWKMRKDIQNLLYGHPHRYEIVGRGETTLGPIRDPSNPTAPPNLAKWLKSGEDLDEILRKRGWPADLVIQTKRLSGSRPITLVVEVEPAGLVQHEEPQPNQHQPHEAPRGMRDTIVRKIAVAGHALAHRFILSELAQIQRQQADLLQAAKTGKGRARPPPWARTLMAQLPRYSRRTAIAFYTGIHPTVAQTETFAQQHAGTQDVAEAYRQFTDAAGFDHDMTIEQHLTDALNTPQRRRAVLQSPHPVWWIVPHEGKLHVIDLKKTADALENRPRSILARQEDVPIVRIEHRPRFKRGQARPKWDSQRQVQLEDATLISLSKLQKRRLMHEL